MYRLHPNPDIPATPPKPFWSTPGGVALVAGLGTLLVGAVAYAATRSGPAPAGVAACGQSWASVPLTALGRPGRYRIDVAVPSSLVSAAYPATQAVWQQQVQQIISQIPKGVTIEGVWLPAIAAGAQSEGPYSYPANTPLPSDWTVPNDGMVHARLQLVWPYQSDILAGIIAGPATTAEMQQVGVAVTLLSCPTGPVPAAQPPPMVYQPVTPDSNGNVTANPGDVWLVSSPPAAAPQTLATAVTALTAAGMAVLASWDVTTTPNDWPSTDSGARWRFVATNTTASPIPLMTVSGENVFAIAGGLPMGVKK